MKVSKKQLIMGLFGVKNLGTCKLINDLIDSQLTAVVKLCICNVDKQKFIIRHVLQSWVQFKESYSKMNHPFSCKNVCFYQILCTGPRFLLSWFGDIKY